MTDEIYEHILYDGNSHCAIATLDGMRDRTITINGMSKSESRTASEWVYSYRNASMGSRFAAR